MACAPNVVGPYQPVTERSCRGDVNRPSPGGRAAAGSRSLEPTKESAVRSDTRVNREDMIEEKKEEGPGVVDTIYQVQAMGARLEASCTI